MIGWCELKTSYSDLIQQIAATHRLDPRVVEAIVLQESSGHTDAFRFEPKFWDRYLSKLVLYRGKVPRRVSSSYGLMQIMYPTAWDRGFRGEPEELFIPHVGLEWGCRHLAYLQAWASMFPGTPRVLLASTLAAYNGGKADNEPGHQPLLRNGRYAAQVLARMEEK